MSKAIVEVKNGERDEAADPAAEWRKLSSYMGSSKNLLNSDLLEVLRMTSIPRGVKPYTKPGITDVTKRARDALEQDPYNIDLICALGCIYLKDANWDKAGNILLRGWKRAGDIADATSRFFFLAKLCEVSYKTARFRQALAVLNDIGEMPDTLTNDERHSFEILSCHVYSKNGDVQRALGAFNACIARQEFKYTVRVWALCQMELNSCGAYEVAKSTMDAMIGGERDENVEYNPALEVGKEMAKSDLQMLEQYLEANKNNHKKKRPLRHGEIPREAIIGGVAFTLFILFLFFYWLESKSLANLGPTLGTK